MGIGKMIRLIARHVLKFALLMVAVSFVVFVLVSVSPIDPVQVNVGQVAYVSMGEEKRAQLQEYWGVGTPLWERYLNWANAVLHGDFGTSLRFNAPVAEVIAVRAGNSLALMAVAWVVSGVLGCDCPQTIEEKRTMLLAHHIALWDVIASCRIEGSSDSSIRDAVPTDLSDVLAHAPIQAVFCNGQTAFRLYARYQEQETGLPAMLLPSTSPANAAYSVPRLLESWSVILPALQK